MAENYDPNALRDLDGIDPEALKKEYWNQEVQRQNKPELRDQYGTYNPNQMLSGYETVGEVVFKNGRWLQGYRDPDWPENGSFPGSPAGVKYIEVNNRGTPKYTPPPGETNPDVVAKDESDRARRRAWSEHNSWELFAAYRDGTGYTRVTGTGEGGVQEWTPEQVKQAFEGNPTRDKRRKHFEDWEAGKVRINGLDFNDRREDGSGPGPVVDGKVDWSNPPENFTAREGLKPGDESTPREDAWNGPKWKVGVFNSIAHGTGWIDEKGILGKEGQYYNYFQIKKIWDSKPNWHTQRDEWREANGFVPGKGWVDGPPPSGLGSLSGYFEAFYKALDEHNGEIPEGTIIINGLTVEEVQKLLDRPSIRREHDRWAEKHPEMNVKPTGEPDPTPEPDPEPDPLNPMGLATGPRQDVSGQIQQLIANHDALAQEGVDIVDLIKASRSLENRMQFLARRGAPWDWRDLTFDQSRFFPDAGTIPGGYGRRQPGAPGYYDPWAWARGTEFGQYQDPNAAMNLARGTQFLGGRPAAPGGEGGEGGQQTPELRTIPDSYWGNWIKDLEKRNFTPSVIKKAAHDHWQPDYTVEEIDNMLDTHFGVNQQKDQAGSTQSTSTGADTGSLKGQDKTQDYANA